VPRHFIAGDLPSVAREDGSTAMNQIFLSYAREDKPRIDEIYGALKQAGLNPWMDEPPRPYQGEGLQPGQRWDEEIRKRIGEARITLTFFSKRSVEKEGYIQREYRLALDRNAQQPQHQPSLIPVLLDACSPPSLRVDTVSYHQLHWYKLYEATVEDLIDRLRKLMADSRGADVAESQYVGQIHFLDGSENCMPSSNAARIETHQAFFRDYSSEEPVQILGTPPRAGESWRVVAEWDAGHRVPKRGDGQKINPPSLVAWSPKAERLFTACDAFGMAVWNTSGMRYEEVFNDAAYGYPRRFFVFQRGHSNRILQETDSYRNRYYYIYDDAARSICKGANQDLWGWVSHEGIKGPYWKYGLDPWRPRSDGELAFVHEYSGLKLVDVNKLSANSKSGEASLHEAPAVHFLKFDSLGKGGSSIFSFHFHPSGEYVAVTTGDWEDRTQRRIHVVHIASAHVVARISASTRELGWSPGGRYLLFKKWRHGADGERTEHLGMWDSHHFMAHYELADDWFSRPWVIRALGGEHDMALSADGQRLLTNSGASVVSVTRERSRLRAGEEVAQIADREFADVAWHPFDPHCFVTVGGKGSEEYPDTYQRDHDMPHGRLLRIWKLMS
jgi:hypothetical protein